jgi:hypothetical protein
MNIELTKPEAAAYHAAIIQLLADVPSARTPALNELIDKLDAIKSKPVAEGS